MNKHFQRIGSVCKHCWNCSDFTWLNFPETLFLVLHSQVMTWVWSKIMERWTKTLIFFETTFRCILMGWSIKLCSRETLNPQETNDSDEFVLADQSQAKNSHFNQPYRLCSRVYSIASNRSILKKLRAYSSFWWMVQIIMILI